MLSAECWVLREDEESWQLAREERAEGEEY